jgi:predicted DNA-binding transcriptional regulator AlpA
MADNTTATPKKIPALQGTTIQILTVQQVADHLRVPPSSVYELTRFRGARGEYPLPCRRVGRYLRFLSSEVDQWLMSLPQATKTTKRKYHKKSSRPKSERS